MRVLVAVVEFKNPTGLRSVASTPHNCDAPIRFTLYSVTGCVKN